MPRNWDALDPAYRKRLENAGVTKKEYEQGESLQAARGHEKTPEHPHEFSPERFPEYTSERRELMEAFQQRKQDLWGDRPNWDAENSANNIRLGVPSIGMLRWAVTASEQELLDAIRENPRTFRFIGYK